MQLRNILQLVAAGSIAAGGMASLGGGTAVAAPSGPAAVAHLLPMSAGDLLGSADSTGPPTTYQCEHGKVITGVDFACYQPFQLQKAYDLAPLYARGIEGQGTTIVIVDPFGASTLRHDLATFDTAFGLPAPPSLRIIQPVGAVAPCSKGPYGVTDCLIWGATMTVAVESAHFIAPQANILLVETPISEYSGVTGFPDIVAAENYVISNHLGDVISQNNITVPEPELVSSPAGYGLRSAYINAAAHGVTVLGATGNQGSTGVFCSPSDRNCANTVCCYSHQATQWPASDPLVTAVGGTQVHLNDRGRTIAPPNVWNDPNSLFSPGTPGTAFASGGGHSIFFSRPAFQDGVVSVVGNARGVPDISMSAAINGALDLYVSAAGGWTLGGGTDQATSEFAGIVALADQMAGHSLGDLNPKLYALGEQGGDNGIVPITTGNNTCSFCSPKVTNSCKLVTVPGFSANGRYNMAIGWGTVDAAKFVPALAH